MLYPEAMSRVTVVSPKACLDRVVEALYDLRVLHLKDHRPQDGDIPIGMPLSEAEHLSQLFLSLQSIKTILKPPAAGAGAAGFVPDLGAIEAFLNKLRQQIDHRIQDIGKQTAELNALEDTRKALEFLEATGLDNTELLQGYETLRMASGTVTDLEKLRAALTDTAIIYGQKKAGSVYPVLLFMKKADEPGVRKALSSLSFAPVSLNAIPQRSVPSALAATEKQRQEKHQQIAAGQAELADLGTLHAAQFHAIEEHLVSRIRKSEAPLKFAVSDYAAIIQGWAPAQNEGRLVGRLSDISENIFIHIEEAGDDAPTALDNPALVRPFQFFLNLFSLPSYREIDPTFLLFISFPFFFGAMLGDIGYGLVVFVVFLALKVKMPQMGGFFTIILLSAASSILFGILFGEFFGAEQILGYPLHPVLHRLEAMGDLIVLSLVFGLVHLNLGYLFGFVNEFRRHGLRHAVLGKLSWIVLETGGILLLLDSFGVLSFNTTISAAVTVLGFLMLVAGEGFMGIIEIPGLISNILSYVRIAAIGLASASLAIVVNKMAGGLFAAGGPSLIMGMIVLLLGHTINILLGILGPFLQTLRLHYVELFPKFYKGGGERYQPFGA